MQKLSAYLLIATLSTIGGLTGCQTAPSMVTPAKSVTLPLTEAKLQNYQWQLVSVTDLMGNRIHPELFNKGKPLLVNFEKEGKVSFANTCNHMWGNYMLTNDNVLVKDFASTMMLCQPESLMAFDEAAPDTLKGQFKLTQDSNGLPVLTVTGKNQISVFKPVNK